MTTHDAPVVYTDFDKLERVWGEGFMSPGGVDEIARILGPGRSGRCAPWLRRQRWSRRAVWSSTPPWTVMPGMPSWSVRSSRGSTPSWGADFAATYGEEDLDSLRQEWVEFAAAARSGALSPGHVRATKPSATC